MQVFKFGLVATAMMLAFSAAAQAGNCGRVTGVGDNFTRDTAVLFSTNALKNSMAARGLVGKGPVRTTCKTGSMMIECRSTQVACKGGVQKACLGPWLCF
ncbi:MAG: hypothetical protein ACK5JT_10905 [Hyphomicrobiaceae bacterium]